MDEVERLRADVSALRHTVYGNGGPGLTENVRHLQESLDDLGHAVERVSEKVTRVQHERDAEANIREGSRRALVQIRTIAVAILALLTAGGVPLTVRLLEALSALADLTP